MEFAMMNLMNTTLSWVKMAVDAPSAQAMVFWSAYRRSSICCRLLLFVTLFLLSQKSYKSPKRPLTKKEIGELFDELKPESLILPITEEMQYEPPVVESVAGPHAIVNGKEVVNFTSANSLRLIGHEKLVESYMSALKKYSVGSRGPRGFYGTIDVHLDFEARIANFLGCPDSILYSYGLSTMFFSTILAFCKKGDIVVVDEGAPWGI